jgi:hypothetical protein
MLAQQGFVVLHAGGADELLVLIMPLFLLAAGWIIVSGGGKREDAEAEDRDQRTWPG